jgi:cation transport ATPase
VAKPTSRKRRKRSRAGAKAGAGSAAARTATSSGLDAGAAAGTISGVRPDPDPAALQRGYARGRAKDEAARAALKPLKTGERPLAVTIGAIAAAVLCIANFVALAFGYNTDEGTQLVLQTALVGFVLALVAWGMWRAKYWAVLGMQTLLALTMVFSALALLTAYNWWAAVLMVVLIATSGTLFWFLIKAMARIQMPPRPGA